MPADYTIELSNFSGPIDLLLHLIRANRASVFDFDLHLITQQYLELVAGEEVRSLENAYYFLLMASTLVEIKSRLLLPAEAGAAERGEPTGEEMKQDLVRRLQTYENLRTAVEHLAARQQEQQRLLPPGISGRLERTLVYSLRDLSLYDLITSFEEVLAHAQPAAELSYSEDSLTVEEASAQVETSLKEHREGVTLAELLCLRPGLAWAVLCFLAVLELITAGSVSFSKQEDDYILLWTGGAAAVSP